MSLYYSHSFHQVTTKEHDFGLGAPVSEAEKYQNILQLEQEVRNQDKFISTLKLQAFGYLRDRKGPFLHPLMVC